MKLARRVLTLALCGVASGAILAPPALAQASPQGVAMQKRQFDIAAGPLDEALNTWSRKTGRSIVFRSEDVSGAKTSGVKGWLTEAVALDRLLRGTGFAPVFSGNGSVAVSRVSVADAEQDYSGGATPDILVTGRNSWSLNTGIQRTQDDSQPFIVLSGEEIRRSGAPNLESYLRDQLNVNSTPGTSEQVKASTSTGGPGSLPSNRGLSQINLRGLGARDTLILVDGRRQAGVNIGDGNLTQPSITGIPIASIERIEILASSASGIYGSGASGGVINIVLKRDFTGGEITANYSNTDDFKMGQGQIDLTYGLPLEGGRTRLSVTGSWTRGLPLLYGERAFLINAQRQIYASNASNLAEGYLGLPIGSAVNYYRPGNQPLTLKAQYGGQRLSSGFGTVPAGFNGIRTDGVNALLAGLGTYNRETPDTSLAPGLRAPLIYGSQRLNGSVTIRREFSDSLSGYIGINAARSKSITNFSRGPDFVDLPSSSPDNPFTSQIRLALPAISEQVPITNEQRSFSYVGGAIIKLSSEWQAALDLSYSTSWYQSDIKPPLVTDATNAGLKNGTQNPLRDLSRSPLVIAYNDGPFGNASAPSTASTFMPSLRIAGPLPVRLPGGKPQLTLNIDHTIATSDPTLSAFINGTSRVTTFTPKAWQNITSVYGEVVFPIFGKANDLPLLRLLELRFSARGEVYRGNGADPVNCTQADYSGASTSNPFSACPGPNDVIKRSVTRNSHVDPSISFRWAPFSLVTFRGSYTTGYLPPQLSQLVPTRDRSFVPFLTDPLRGGEFIGSFEDGAPYLDTIGGGNPDVLPEKSRSLSLGAIVTPSFIPGLRFSADWTKLKKRDIYFSPASFLFFNLNAQQDFETFIATKPERVTRGPASDGFSVGPITQLDLSLINLTGASTETVDFVGEYERRLFGGTFNFLGRATYVRSLFVEPFPGKMSINYAGLVTRGFAEVGGFSSLKWRGSGSVNWTKGGLTLGWQSRFFDKYRLRETGQPAGQGSPFVASQLFHDASVSYRFDFGATVRAGVNNVFNKWPAFDADAFPLYYSSYADPRLRNFYLSVSKTF